MSHVLENTLCVQGFSFIFLLDAHCSSRNLFSFLAKCILSEQMNPQEDNLVTFSIESQVNTRITVVCMGHSNIGVLVLDQYLSESYLVTFPSKHRVFISAYLLAFT
jgi:hypothetical protein